MPIAMPAFGFADWPHVWPALLLVFVAGALISRTLPWCLNCLVSTADGWTGCLQGAGYRRQSGVDEKEPQTELTKLKARPGLDVYFSRISTMVLTSHEKDAVAYCVNKANDFKAEGQGHTCCTPTISHTVHLPLGPSVHC